MRTPTVPTTAPGSLTSEDEFLALDAATFREGDRFVFRQVNWTIRENEQWAILGPNGAGKSFFTRVLTGEIAPVRGEIRWAFTRGAAPEHHVALVSPGTHAQIASQESSFYQSRWHSGLQEGQRTVQQFLSQPAIEGLNPFELGGVLTNRTAFLQRRREAMHLLGIRSLWRRRLRHLSNGEMRKVLLARALAGGPKLLVLDEPFAGLDVATRRRLATAIARLMATGLKVIVVTSRHDEIPPSATHLLLIDAHQVVAQGRRESLERSRPGRLESWTASRRGTASRRPATGGMGPSSEFPRTRRERRILPALVELRAVTVRYGSRSILRAVSWTVRRGERWLVTGPNGSGKSTLLSLVQGDNPQAYAREIRLFGRDPDSTQALWLARRRLGWFSPELHLHYPAGSSCLDVVCSGFHDSIGLYEPVSRARRQLARRWMAKLGLGGCAAHPLGELPHGDQRLVLLARALVKRPALLILDEPCQGLDAPRRRLVLATVDEYVEGTHASLIFVTHHPRERPRSITHELVLRAGRVVRQALVGKRPARRR